MIYVTVSLDSECDVQGLKEILAMFLERFGDVKVISVTEKFPEQLVISEAQQPLAARKELR